MTAIKTITLNSIKLTLLALSLSILMGSCKEKDAMEDVTVDVTYDTDFETPDWTTETHSNDAEPNFAVVFADNEVKRIDLVITADRWQAMLDDMTELYGSFGVNTGGPDGGFSDENPIFVPAEILFEGKEWYRVGVRFKGNSSLASTWKSGNMKLSFKLDFDEFEEDYPEIKNQRFYGFKKLSLKNNYDDLSQMREKVSSDIFRSAGLASPRTAFYTVYVGHGDGPIYFGLYTVVEEISDTVIDTQFADNDGNLYEPDGDAASFTAGSFNKADFGKENNEDAADWSDIEGLFAALHDATRTSNPAAWRSKLDAVLDTDTFLKYLAVNTVIQNWDTYGKMTHNYYLYNNPDNGLLTWIPWDNNEALQNGKMGGSLPLNFSGLSSSQWPLISFLYADKTYKGIYDTYVEETINSSFNTSDIQATYSTYATLISPYATTELEGYTFLRSSSDFETAVSTLKSHASQRATAVAAYLQ
jgi:spore coat protein H